MITRTPTNFTPPAWYRNAPPMVLRVGSGLIGAALYIAIVFVNTYHGLPFAFGVALFSVLGASELYRAVRSRHDGEPTDILGFLGCIAFQIAAWTHSGERFKPYLPGLLMLLVISALIAELVKRRPKPITNVSTTLLGAVYAGWLFSYLTLLRGTPDSSPVLVPPLHGTTVGEWLVIYVSTSTWLSDVGALFIGRKFGRHPMAPEISPKKTWEGSIGGLLASLLLGGAFGVFLHIPPLHAFILSLLCGMVGQVGDLSESALKRDLGLRDFGDLLPGHGGILDRIDSLLFAAPMAYYYIAFFLSKPH